MEKNKSDKTDQTNKVSEENNELTSLKEEVEALKKKNVELDELVKFQVATERNSLRRRDEAERDLRKYAAKELGQLLIPEVELLKQVLASLEKHDNKELKNYLMGFEMVVKKISNDLEEVGIKQMPIKVGDEFNERYQEAVEKVANSEYEPGKVVVIINNGYMIHDKVLVHAKVKISGIDQETDNSENENDEQGEN